MSTATPPPTPAGATPTGKSTGHIPHPQGSPMPPGPQQQPQGGTPMLNQLLREPPGGRPPHGPPGMPPYPADGTAPPWMRHPAPDQSNTMPHYPAPYENGNKPGYAMPPAPMSQMNGGRSIPKEAMVNGPMGHHPNNFYSPTPPHMGPMPVRNGPLKQHATGDNAFATPTPPMNGPSAAALPQSSSENSRDSSAADNPPQRLGTKSSAQPSPSHSATNDPERENESSMSSPSWPRTPASPALQTAHARQPSVTSCSSSTPGHPGQSPGQLPPPPTSQPHPGYPSYTPPSSFVGPQGPQTVPQPMQYYPGSGGQPGVHPGFSGVPPQGAVPGQPYFAQPSNPPDGAARPLPGPSGQGHVPNGPPPSTGRETGDQLAERLLVSSQQIELMPPEEVQRRRQFYQQLVHFCESQNLPVTAQPTVSKQPVDLYLLYVEVKKRGGFEEVCRKKTWREICQFFNIGQSNSASGQMKKQYSKYLLPFECAFDRGGVDPEPIRASVESKKKRSKPANANANASGPVSEHAVPYGHGQQIPPGYPAPPTDSAMLGQPGTATSASPYGTPGRPGEMVASDPFSDQRAHARTSLSPGYAAAPPMMRPPQPMPGQPHYGPGMGYPNGHPGMYDRSHMPGPYPYPQPVRYPPTSTSKDTHPPYSTPGSSYAHPVQPHYVNPVPVQPPHGPTIPQPKMMPPASAHSTPGPRPYAAQRAPYGGPVPANHYQAMPKREHGHAAPSLQFPHGSIEATTPSSPRRKRRLRRADIDFSKTVRRFPGAVDAWRLVMALRSGLPAEAYWALNVLTVLLYDDEAVHYFNLATLPGLLDTVVDMYVCALERLFGADEFADCVDPPVVAIAEALADTPSVKDADCTATTSVVKSKLPHYPTREQQPPVRFGTRPTPRPHAPALSGFSSEAGTARLYGCEPPAELHLDRTGRLPALYRTPSPEPSSTASSRRSSVNCRKRSRSSSPSEDAAPKRKHNFFYNDESFELSETVNVYRAKVLDHLNSSRKERIELCRALSGVIRGLSFIPGNDRALCQNGPLLAVVGRLLLMRHEHVASAGYSSERVKQEQHELEESLDEGQWQQVHAAQQSAHETPVPLCDDEWWAPTLTQLRDDAFVVLCNTSAQLELSELSSSSALSICDALLHWTTCPSSYAQDPLMLLPNADLSPYRYSLEILTKLSVQEANVDALLASPPWSRIERCITLLAASLCQSVELPVSEFALVLLSAFASHEVAAVYMARCTPIIPNMIAFLERADMNMAHIVNSRGMKALRDNIEIMGTTVGMLRRAANALLSMARMPACQSCFARHQQTLLKFTMSQLMDSRVAATIAETLYELQHGATKLDLAAPHLRKVALTNGVVSGTPSEKMSETDSQTPPLKKEVVDI